MYIEPVPRLTHLSHLTRIALLRHRPSLRFLFATGGLCGALFLGGCNLFDGGSDTSVTKPATLQPEQDAFSKAASRVYTWDESLRRPGKSDSLVGQTVLVASRLGDTLIGGVIKTRLNLARRSSTGPAPVATLTRIGFQPGLVLFDSTLVSDPGPGLPFPAAPALGWRLDTTVGALRFVRVLDRVESLTQAGTRFECWAFAESTFWADNGATPIGTGTTWMGARGLVKHQSLWSGFTPSPASAGTLFREITAE